MTDLPPLSAVFFYHNLHPTHRPSTPLLRNQTRSSQTLFVNDENLLDCARQILEARSKPATLKISYYIVVQKMYYEGRSSSKQNFFNLPRHVILLENLPHCLASDLIRGHSQLMSVGRFDFKIFTPRRPFQRKCPQLMCTSATCASDVRIAAAYVCARVRPVRAMCLLHLCASATCVIRAHVYEPPLSKGNVRN